MVALLLDVAAVQPPETGDGWIDVCRSGTVYGGAVQPDGKVRKVTLTPEEIRGCATATNAAIASGRWPGGPPVTANHASRYTPDPDMARRFGWIAELRAEDRDGQTYLLARVEWTDEGRALVDSGAYGGFSAELDDAEISRDKDTGRAVGAWVLTGGTLTNEPMISRLRPLSTRGAGAALTLSEGSMPENASLLGALRALAAAPTKEGMDALVATWAGMSPETQVAVMAEIAAAGGGAPAVAQPEMEADPGAGAPGAAVLAEDPRVAVLLAETRRMAAENEALRRHAADRVTADRKAKLDGWQAEGRFSPVERATVERLMLAEGIGPAYVEAQYPVGRVVGQPAGHSGAGATVVLAERQLETAAATTAKTSAATARALRAAAKMPGGLNAENMIAALGAV